MRILYIEDDPNVASAISEMLRTFLSGVEVDFIFCQTLAEARSVIGQQRTALDLVLIDLNLPNSQGRNTLRNLAEFAGDIPLVVLTGMRYERLAIESYQLGFWSFTGKDRDSINRLAAKIPHIVRRHAVIKSACNADKRRELLERARTVYSPEFLTA